MSALNYGSQPSSAPYPATMYPASSFFGAVGLQPGGANASGDNGGNAQLTPMDKRHMVATILVLVVVGYVLYHFNYKD